MPIYCDPPRVNQRGHPLSRTYGAILQSSLTSVLPALGLSSRLPVSVLVRSHAINPKSFSWTSLVHRNINALSMLRMSLRICSATLHKARDIYPSLTFQTPSSISPACGTGMLTCYPSSRLSASTKEPANPGRIYLPQETLGFRRAGFSPALSLLIPA